MLVNAEIGTLLFPQASASGRAALAGFSLSMSTGSSGQQKPAASSQEPGMRVKC